MLLCSHIVAASKGHVCVKCCYVHVRQDWLFCKKGVKRNRFVLSSWAPGLSWGLPSDSREN